MKNVIFTLAVAATVLAGAMFTACESTAKKADDAQGKVVEAKEDLTEAQKEAAVATQKAADEAAWKAFKTESEAKIKDNDTYIAALKTGMKSSGKKMDAVYANSIDVLEKKNKDLQARIDAYDKTQSNWETFKGEFNHDMEGLGVALKDLGVNNKK